jgi:MoaA/NifB/PqqE/SkfB family radical SAM enzyme
MRILGEFGIPCQILTHAAHRNVPEGLKGIIALSRELGCMSVSILHPVASGRWIDSYQEVLSEEEKEQIRELQDMTRVHLEMPSQGSLCYSCQRLVLSIGAQGHITQCPFIPYALGNVRQHALADVWRLHTSGLELELGGTCPMNDPTTRAALQKHADSVAVALGYRRSGQPVVGWCRS